MSVLSIAQDILIIVKAIHLITVEIKGNKNKAQRLVARINTIIPTIYMITQDPSKVVCTVERLQDLLSYIQGIKAFIEKFNNSSYFGKAFSIGSDNLAFAEFNDGLGVRMEALQFNIQVNAEKQRQEDQQDAEADADEMRDMIKQVLQSQGVMQEEINNQLQNLTIQNRQMFSDQNSIIQQGNAEILRAINSLQNGQMNNLPPIRTIAPEQLEYVEDDSSLIGQGGFGAIYAGTYLGLDVAIKTIKNPNITRAMKEELQKEALTMQTLDFPGIIHFYGAQLESAPRFIVMERAMCSLFDLLYNPQKFVPDLDLTLYLRLDLLGDIARSVEYIHSVGIVHGDIKSHNILLSTDMKPKITDFGLSKGKGDKDVCTTVNSDGSMDFKGSPAYLAPEIFLESSYSKFSDVYSFAVVMNEVLARKVPHDQVAAADIMYHTVTAKTRPALFTMNDLIACVPVGYSLDPNVMIDTQALITKGWSEIPSQRPLFHILSKSLERLAGSVKGGLGNSVPKNGKSFSTGSRVSPRATEPAMDPAKEAVYKELSTWLVNKVELFPDAAQSIAKLLVGAGITNLKKLDSRIKKIPTFLDSLGVGEFEATDIQSALDKEMALLSSNSEPVTPSKPKRVSAETKADPQYERKLMMKARECTSISMILDVLNGVMQIEPLTSIYKDTLRELFKVVANLCFNNVVNQTDLGKCGGCTMIGTLLYAYHDGLENGSRVGHMNNFDSNVLESGLWCLTVLAMNNTDNQKSLGEAGCCALIVALLNRHGSSNAAIAEQALRAIENLTVEASNRELFGQQGICQVLVSTLGMYCTVRNDIVEHCLAAISNLCRSSRQNQDNFMRCNVCPPLMNAVVAMGPSQITVADFGIFTIRSLCMDNYEAIMAFAQYDVVNTILQLMYTHGSHSITVTESGLGALSVLCGVQMPMMQPPRPNPHMNILYYNDNAVNMINNAVKSYSAKSKHVTAAGFGIYTGLLNHMTAFNGNPFANNAILINPKIANDTHLRELVLLIVNGVKIHGVSHLSLVEPAIVLLKKITSVAVAANVLAVYSCFGEVNIGAVVADIFFTHRSHAVIAGHCIEMFIALSGITDFINKLTSGPNLNLYKFVIEVIASLQAKNECSLALLDRGILLYSALFSHIPAGESNLGDANSCKFLLQILASLYKQCFDHSVPVSTVGVTPIVALQTTLAAIQVLSTFPPNKATIGDCDGCRLLCDITRSFASDVVFSGRNLEILANLTLFNANEARLIQAGVCQLTIDLLIKFAYNSEMVTTRGLVVITNLANSNKLMLGDLNICPIIVDVIRFYVSHNSPYINAVALQASVAIHNLASRCGENKQRFLQLNVVQDLQNLLNSPSLTQQARDEIKGAINAIRFEQ